MKKGWSVLLSGLMTVNVFACGALLSGCGEALGASVEGRLSVWVPEGQNIMDMFEDMAADFEAETGTPVSIIPYMGLSATEKLELDGPFGKGGDIYIQNGGGDLAGAVEKGLFMALSSEELGLDTALLPGMSELMEYQGVPYGVPLGAETNVMFYNKEILPLNLNYQSAGSTDMTLYIDTLFPTRYSFQAFVDLFTDTDFLEWYGNTLIVGAMNAFLCLILVLPTAYALSRLRFKGRKNYLLVFLVLQMFPGTMSMVAYYVILNMLGLLDTYFGLVLVFACTAIPGSTFLMKGYLDTISREVEEAAMLDGASRLQSIVRIILPLAKPMVGLVCLFGFASPFGDYMLSKILITDPGKYTLALGIYQSIYSQQATNYALFAAAALLSSLPMTVIYMCLQKVIINGLSGATK